MSFAFQHLHGLVIVNTEIASVTGSAILRLALDTGATATMLNAAPLVALGYDPALAPDRIQVTTGSGIEFVPRLVLTRIKALGCEEQHFPVLCHTLPPTTGVDGVLGLDFRLFRVNSRSGGLPDCDTRQFRRLLGCGSRRLFW